MKKIAAYILFLAFIGILSCEDNPPADELNFNAPNGDKLAIADVNSWTSKVISKKFGSFETFTITGIQYHKFNDGYGAMISFDVNGKGSSFMMRRNTNLLINGRTEQDPCPNWLIYCLGNQCCTMNYNAPSGNVTCACEQMGSGCHMEFECVRQD